MNPKELANAIAAAAADKKQRHPASQYGWPVPCDGLLHDLFCPERDSSPSHRRQHRR